MTTMASKARILGDRTLIYAVHDVRAPSPQAWDEYVEHCRDAFRRCPYPGAPIGFAVTDGGAPNAKHRRQLNAVTREVYGLRTERIRSAVISDSVLVRAVVATFSWWLPEI